MRREAEFCANCCNKNSDFFMPNLNKLHTGLFLVILAIAPQVRSQVPDYEPPRTEYGRPDLRSSWTNRSISRMEGRPGVEGLLLRDEEAYEMAQSSVWLSLDRQQHNNPVTEAKAGQAAFGARGHNAFWVDNGDKMGIAKGEYRTSWVTEPASGRIPYK